MEIVKKINNNVVLVQDEHNKTMIFTGKGIGYNAIPKAKVDEQLIQHRYVLQENESKHILLPLLDELPPEILAISEEVVVYAEKKLDKKLAPTLFVTLADHIHTAMKRDAIHHPWEWEIKHFYQQEVAVSKQALIIIEEKSGYAFNECEAYFIALHFVNAQINNSSDNFYALEMAGGIAKILNIIKYHFNMEIAEDSVAFSRFLVHLKFYLIRYLGNESDEKMDNNIVSVIQATYPEGYACAEKIALYMEKVYGRPTTESEKAYLTLHIERIYKVDESNHEEEQL